MIATCLRIAQFDVAEEGNGWTVRRRTGRVSEKSGEEIVQLVGYYSDLEHALRSVLRERMRGHGAVDARVLLAAIESSYAGIRAAVQP